MDKVDQVTQEHTQEPASGKEAEQNAPPSASSEESGDMSQFETLFEESFQDFQEGEVIQGKVVRYDRDTVMVDVGYKTEAQIPISEFLAEDGTLTVAPGQSIELLIDRWRPSEGIRIFSYSKLVRNRAWEQIIAAYENQIPVSGRPVARVKGGYSFIIGDAATGVKAFLPLSQVDLRPVADPDSVIGQAMECLVIKCNRRRENVVVSRRSLIEREREKQKEKTLSTLSVDQVRDGIVKNITDYGVFVDLGGIDGLLHVTDISWGRTEHPSKRFHVGDSVKVKVLQFDPVTEKVSLGVKQLTEDPWLRVEEKYPVASRVEGKVVSLTDYGAFIELEEGVEGLVHISEMSWTKRIRHPSQLLKPGDHVQAVVLKVDPASRRISLGLKQIEPNPWELLHERYPVGTVIEGTVKNVTDFGIFIGIEEGIDGLVHISDLSWSKRIKHPGDLYKKGDVIQAVVLHIDAEKERFSLGVKQLTPDPWQSVTDRYPIGSLVTGKVTNVTDFGVFVEIEDGVEGLIHVSEIGPGKVKTPVGMYETGAEVTAKVIHVAPLERRIGLSIKRIGEDEERAMFAEYSSARGNKGGATIGSLLQEELVHRGNSRS
ncbi:MAG: 30S ribosomal protein S1 [Deltaproteobacteria bacterium]